MLRSSDSTAQGTATGEAGNSVPASAVYAWYVVAVLMTCYTLSFVDRQILSLLVIPIKRDLSISDTRIALLQGFAFVVFYTFLGLPMGRLSDTRTRRTLISAGVLCWSLMTIACAAAASFWSMFVARIGVGIGEATLGPAALSLIADYFPESRLGKAISTYTLGIFIGSASALIGGGMVLDAMAHIPFVRVPLFGQIASWRLSFLIAGIPGMAMAALLFTIREPRRRNSLLNREGLPARLSLGEVIAEIIARIRPTLGISVGFVFQSMVTYAFTAWAPTFLQRTYGWSPGHTGRTIGFAILFAGGPGMFAGGWLCDYWRRRGTYEAPLKVAALSGLGNLLFFVPAFLVRNSTVTQLLLWPALFMLGMPIGSVFASLQWIYPNQARGQVSALLLLITNLGGLSLGPLLPALLNDYVFHSEKMLGLSLALTIIMASVLQMVAFASTYKSYRGCFESRAASENVAPL